MKLSITVLIVCLSMLFLPQQTIAQQHQHVAAIVIDGSKNPELIPDSTAFRHWLLMASVVPNAPNGDFVRQQAEVSKLRLVDSEKLKLLTILADFRSQYEALIQQHNEQAQAGKHPDINLLLQQRDSLVEATRVNIRTILLPNNADKIENAVQAYKIQIKIQTSSNH